MNEQTIKSVMATDAFAQAASKLMGQLSIGRQDAKQELITELLIHRLNNWTDEEVQDAIQTDDYSLPVLIHHARQDAARRHWSADARQNAVAEKLKDADVGAGEDAGQQVESPGVLAEAMTIVAAVFTNTATREWVESVLTVGKEETMARYDMTPRQFTVKMAKVTKRLADNQDTIDHVRAEYETRPLRAERDELLKLVRIVESEDYTDSMVQEWIDAHPMLANDLVDDPAIRYQKRVIENFSCALTDDKYQLVTNAYTRIGWYNEHRI